MVAMISRIEMWPTNETVVIVVAPIAKLIALPMTPVGVALARLFADPGSEWTTAR